MTNDDAFLELAGESEIGRPDASVYDATPSSLPDETASVVPDHLVRR